MSTYNLHSPESFDIVVGDEKQPNFKPRMKIKRWDNEVNFSVGLISAHGGNHAYVSDKVMWSDGHGVSASFYRFKTPDSSFELPAQLEFEVVLASKPATNTIEFSIETKKLDFFYQPPLTQDEIDDGWERPKNVIGSYAVYHSDKVGDKYHAGKAFHIYRPFAIDAEGREVWCDLHIDVGSKLLTITVPQDFIDDAVYPIVVDPTFGVNPASPGSSSVQIDVSKMYGSLFTSPSNIDTAQKFTAYTGSAYGSTIYIKGCFVLHSNLNIITNGVGAASAGFTTNGWHDSVFGTDPEPAQSTDHVLMVIGSAGGCKLYYDSGDTNQGHYDATNSYTSPTNPTDAVHDNNKYSIYCTYTESAPPFSPVHPKLIAQDTAGTFDCNVAAFTSVPFNNLVKEDDDTIIDKISNTQYRLKEAGHYLAFYNIAARNDTYANRQEFRTRMYLEGAAINYGQGQGYRRDANNDRFSAFGGAIINASADDDLEIQVLRSTTNSNAHTLEANRSGLQILRLDDDHQFFRARSTDTSAVSNSAYHDVTWNTEDEKDASFTHAANSATIALAVGYFYVVCYNIRSASTGLKRTTMSTRVTLDGTESEYGWSYTYIRGLEGCTDGCCSAMFLVDATADAKDLIVQCQALNAVETDSQALVSGESAISIWRLPTQSECLMVHSSNDQDCSGQTGIIIHETEDEEDASSFNHNNTTGRCTIVGDQSDFLWMHGGRANKTGAGATRTSFGTTWRKDATIQTYGRGYCYIRGVETSGGNTMDGGINCATIFDGLEAGDVIDVALSDEGDNGDGAENLITDQHGMCAINLCATFTPTVGVAPTSVFAGPLVGPLGGPIQ